MIAFGTGLLVSSLLPPSKVEPKAADKVKNTAQPLVDDLDLAKWTITGQRAPFSACVRSVAVGRNEPVDQFVDIPGLR